MPVPADLIERKEAHFVLWRPSASDKPPRLVIGRFQPGNPPQLADEQSFPLEQDAQKKGLWSIAASDCGLESGHVYHYWFEVEDTNPQRQDAVPAKQVRCTDPAAYTVDWRLLAPPLPPPFTEDNRQPAAVIKFENDRLLAADPGGEAAAFPDDPGPDTLPANNRLVIYELPTAWSRTNGLGPGERGVGTFQDVLALIDEAVSGANFAGVHACGPDTRIWAHWASTRSSCCRPKTASSSARGDTIRRTFSPRISSWAFRTATLGQPPTRTWRNWSRARIRTASASSSTW